MKKAILNKNTGYIPDEVVPEDYIAGGITGVTYEEIETSGDWLKDLPTNERQSNDREDYMNCVTQAGHNSLETQLNCQMRQSKIPLGLINWCKAQGYLDENDHWNFNDCFTAKMINTTDNGAQMKQFWDGVRHNGLLPEMNWHHTIDNLPWDKYYEPIPQPLKDKALSFLRFFEIQYEWVNAGDIIFSNYETIAKHIKQAPMHIATAVCSGWNGYGVIPACNWAVQHATMAYNVLSNETDIYDTYVPFLKRLDAKYLIPYMLKGIIKAKTFTLTTEMARFAYCQRLDLRLEFPAEAKFYSIHDPQYTLYDWCRQMGTYEMPEVFIDNLLDWTGIEEILKAEDMPELKKKTWFEIILMFLKDIFIFNIKK